MAITVYGASDDLVEVEGDIREEFNPASDDEPSYLAFSDGTVLSIHYTERGIWRITPVARGDGSGVLTIHQVVSEDPDSYTDRAEIAGDIRWVVFGPRVELKR
jgi:hypothetical protein